MSTRPLTASERATATALRDEHLALVTSQAIDARSALPGTLLVAAAGLLAVGLGAWAGGLAWVAALAGALIAAVFGWISWVLLDDVQRAPARAAEAVARVDADLAAGQVEVETLPVEQPWALYTAEDDEAEPVLAAVGLPAQERVILLDTAEHLPAAIDVLTLPTSRWRWVEPRGGPVEPVEERRYAPDMLLMDTVARVRWEQGEPLLEGWTAVG